MTSDGQPHAETRRMMDTAIRRLNVLEYIILGLAMVLALAAGALTAWILKSVTGASFRVSWMIASVLFFAVPGTVALLRERRQGPIHQMKDPKNGSTTQRNDG